LKSVRRVRSLLPQNWRTVVELHWPPKQNLLRASRHQVRSLTLDINSWDSLTRTLRKNPAYRSCNCQYQGIPFKTYLLDQFRDEQPIVE
jgi:hypothetical protein